MSRDPNLHPDARVEGLRYGTQGGIRYVARDVILGKATMSCQSAVWDEGEQEVVWLPNKPYDQRGRSGEQGGFMYPFEGPDDVWEQITTGGNLIWDS